MGSGEPERGSAPHPGHGTRVTMRGRNTVEEGGSAAADLAAGIRSATLARPAGQKEQTREYGRSVGPSEYIDAQSASIGVWRGGWVW